MYSRRAAIYQQACKKQEKAFQLWLKSKLSTPKTVMTPLLEKALSEIYKLSPEEQDAIAAVILEELEDERRWNKAFAESQDKLAQLAHKVRADIWFWIGPHSEYIVNIKNYFVSFELSKNRGAQHTNSGEG